MGLFIKALIDASPVLAILLAYGSGAHAFSLVEVVGKILQRFFKKQNTGFAG